MEENLKQHNKVGATKIIRIAIFGPESTGKTTLATQLAAFYKTAWVPEFARDYLQEKLDSGRGICEIDDMLTIAYGQTNLENEKAEIAETYLFCDTNLMVTKVFSEIYYDYCDPKLNKAAIEQQYDLYFLTDIDVPWEDDGLRDSPEGRETIFSVFKQSLIDNKKPFITLTGDKETRLNNAVSILEELPLAYSLGISSLDFVQMYEHGIPMNRIQQQLEFYNNGISKLTMDRPATIADGILQFSDLDFQKAATFFDSHKNSLKLQKLVPASGAASRMFKFLNEFLNDFLLERESINAYINRKKAVELSLFLVGIEKFPFYSMIIDQLKAKFDDFEQWSDDDKNYYFIKFLLNSDYFDCANKPKGVLPFHHYQDHIATPLEEHLNESVYYTAVDQKAHLHFTISNNHAFLFKDLELLVKPEIESKTDTRIEVSYSNQHKATDSIVVLENNEFLRTETGKIVFRPGGHGALIENMNDLDADIIFIKNIDNVIQNHIQEIALYKKALAGVLVQIQQRVFSYLNQLESGNLSHSDLNEIELFIQKNLNLGLSSNYFDGDFDAKVNQIKDVLNRPVRVCGMVKNEGEPGGGPFWVRDFNGTVSLQIVESAQIDSNSEVQNKILQQATHFNPVDLVCGIKNYKNEKFDLTQFVEPKSGFILERSLSGQRIKSYELPGLWNGAMANWITIFVEVPIFTFSPVKTVNDLLKPAHQHV